MSGVPVIAVVGWNRCDRRLWARCRMPWTSSEGWWAGPPDTGLSCRPAFSL